MKKLHIEIDCIITDRTIEKLQSYFPEESLIDNVIDALEMYDESEYISNLTINIIE